MVVARGALWAQLSSAQDKSRPVLLLPACPAREAPARLRRDRQWRLPQLRLSDSATSFPTAGSIAPPICRTTPPMPSPGVLLAIFERPPEATGDTINSAVVIAAEPLPAGHEDSSRIFRFPERSSPKRKASRQKKSPASFLWERSSWCAETSAKRGERSRCGRRLWFYCRRDTQFRSPSSAVAQMK